MVIDDISAKSMDEIKSTYASDQAILKKGNPQEIMSIAHRHALELKIDLDAHDQLNEDTLVPLLRARFHPKHPEYRNLLFSKNPDRTFHEEVQGVILQNIKNGKLLLPQFSEELDKASRASLVGDGGAFIRSIFFQGNDPDQKKVSSLRAFVKVFPSRESARKTRQNEYDLSKIESLKDIVVIPHYSKGLISSYFFLGLDGSRFMQKLKPSKRSGFVNEILETYSQFIEEATKNRNKLRGLNEHGNCSGTLQKKFFKRLGLKIGKTDLSELLLAYQMEIGKDLEEAPRWVMNGDSKLSNTLVSEGKYTFKNQVRLCDWEFLISAPIQKFVYDIQRSCPEEKNIAGKVMERFHYKQSEKKFNETLKKMSVHESLLSAARCVELSRNPKIRIQRELEEMARMHYTLALENM